jgi:ABC-type uncharacterized transport system ATPase subunit
MRCDLAITLLHEPELLFLDEPTIGLDAVSKLAVREFIAELNKSGVTVILTTHDMDDIEALCSADGHRRRPHSFRRNALRSPGECHASAG